MIKLDVNKTLKMMKIAKMLVFNKYYGQIMILNN